MRPARYIISLLSLFLLTLLACRAQATCGIVGYAHTIHTNIFGQEESDVVTGFTVTLQSQKDTITTVSRNGDFQFQNLSPGVYTIKIEMKGYKTFTESVELTDGDQAMVVELVKEGGEIQSAVVTAEQPVITRVADTLVFHASAVKRMAGDFAIDLISQMPGAEVSDSGIKIGGKDLRRAYVNGVLVFGRNPMDAMRNLAAEEVITMNIYDEKISSSPSSPDVKEMVVNIKTRNPILDVTDIQAIATVGMDQARSIDGDIRTRYAEGFMGKFFSESLLLKADVLTNNVGIESLSGYAADVLNTPISPLTRQGRNTVADLSVEKYWGRNYNTRTGLLVRYSYSDGYTSTPGKTLTRYYSTRLTPERSVSDSSSSMSTMRSHSLRTEFQKQLGNHRLTWSNNLTIGSIDNSSYRERTTAFGADRMLENSSSSRSTESWKIDENVILGGRLRIALHLNAEKQGTEGWMIDTLGTSSSRRYLEMSGDGISWGAGGDLLYMFSFPWTRSGDRLVVQASSDYTSRKTRQISTDLLGVMPSMDPVNSFDYTYSVLANKLDLTYIHSRLNAGVTWNLSTLVDTERLPQNAPGVNRAYLSILPKLHFSPKAGINLNMTSSVSIPSLEQVRERIDNVNPFSVVAGNSALKPGRDYTLSASFSDEITISNGLRLTATYTDRPVVRREHFFQNESVLQDYGNYLMPAGATLHTYDNADWALRSSASYQHSGRTGSHRLLPAIQYIAYLDLNGNMTPSYLQEDLYRTTDMGARARISANTTASEKLRVGIDASAGFDKSASSISDKSIGRIGINFGGNVTFRPARLVLFESRYTKALTKILGDQQARSHDFLKLSAGLDLFSNRLKVLVEGIDLLSGKDVYTTSFTENAFSQSYSTVFGRYFLITVKYRFNSSQGKFFQSSFHSEL